MQRPDDAKRASIMTAAVRLFSRKPFHEVLLDDVAAAAKVGKGTVYIYFKSKEDLYDTLVLEAFSKIVDRLRELADDSVGSAWQELERMVNEMVTWASANPNFFRMMMQGTSDRVRPCLTKKRKELGKTFEIVLRRGVKSGEMRDTNPALTAQYIPACIRSAIKYGSDKQTPAGITKHLMGFLGAMRTEGTSR